MSKIVVYTFDGTASGMDGLGGPTDYQTPNFSYPQKVAKRLQDYNPNIYEWFPVDYTPYLFLTEFRTMIERSDVALSIVVPDVLSRPAGTKFVLCALSQGTLSSGRLYNEFRYGSLQSRKDDLIAVINFGDLLKPAGWSLPMEGSVSCPGHGIVGNIPLAHSFGNIPALISDPDPFYLSFNQPGDIVGCNNLTGSARQVMDYMWQRVLYGVQTAQGIRVVGAAPDDGGAETLIDGIVEAMYDETGFTSLSAGQQFDVLAGIAGAIGSMLSLLTGSIVGFLDSVIDGVGTFLSNAVDPHQQYDRNPAGAPWPYLGIPGNTKTAVQLAYEWAVENLTPQVEPSPTVIYTGGLATTSGGKNKPIFYYAQGTSWLWNWFGFQAGSQGGGGSVQIGNSGIFVPDVYVLNGVPLFGQPYIPATHIKGLNGQFVYWEGGIVNDPFPYLLDTDLWHWKRVPYPASTAFMGPSIEVGVDWVINDILSQPPGTSFALGGYSQGAAVMSRVYNEFRSGRLAGRREALRAMVTFGNPMREQGHTFPGSGYSGACDIPGDNTSGHGTFPALEDVDDLLSPFVRRFARLQNTEELVWDFTMPNEVISGVGNSPDGRFLQNFTTNALRLIPLAALLDIGKAMGDLWTRFGVAPAGVPQGTDPNGIGYKTVKVVNPLTGEVGYQPGGGHIMYPFFPPPNADGTIPASGDTCYQLAAKYLNSVGRRINDELHPVFVPALAGSASVRPSFSWFTSLPGE